MVLQKAVNHLRNRPRDERRATALSVAILIVALLFVGWAILFFKKVKSSSVRIESIGASVNSKFDLSAVQEAQRQFVDGYSNTGNTIQQAQAAQSVY